MMLLDSWNPVFRVRFENDKSLNEEFEYKEEALEYAKFHLDSKPIVEGLEVYINDLGIVTEEAEPEEIYSYLTEAKKEEEPKVKLDRLSELEAELNRLENDKEEPIAGDSDFGPESSITIEVNPANQEDVNVISPAEEPADVEEPEDFDPYGFMKGAEVEEPSFVDPFATDFSDISEDEAAVSDVVNHGIEPVDFLNDLAKQLGIADDVIITSTSEEFPEAEPIETCSDEFGAFNCFDDEEPKTEVVVTAEVPADTIDQISSENATVKVDADGVEAPAETVSTCTVCPECGKEVCCDDKECCCDNKEDCCDDEQKPLNEYHDHEDHTIESEQELKGTDNAVVKCKVADVVTHSEDEKPVDCLGKKKPLEEPLVCKKITDNLYEAKKDDELPVDPEAAKLGVHTMLNNLVADEIEAINGYDDAKAQIIDTPIEHKDNILDTIDHIKGEEQEHIDELIDATTEIPFDKEEETPAPEVEEPLNQDSPEVNEKLDKDSKLDYDTLKEIKSNIYNVIKKYWETVFSDEWFYEDSFSLEQDYYDEKLLFVKFKPRKEVYFKKESSFENFKADLKTIPGLKLKAIHKKLVNVNFYSSDDARFIKVDEIVFKLIDKSLTETKAKPEGDKVKAYNNALKYAKKENKPFIYGYTNHTGKFFAADTPMKVSGNPADAEKEFRNRYKNCSVVYVAYPDKEFIKENLNEDFFPGSLTRLVDKYDIEIEWRGYGKTKDQRKYLVKLPVPDKRRLEIWKEVCALNPVDANLIKSGISLTLDSQSILENRVKENEAKETLEEPINEELKVIVDFSDYTPWSGAVDTYDVIERAGKLDELEAYLESVFPDGATTTQINDLLWFDGEEVLEALGLTSVEAEDEMSDQELAEKLWNAHCEKVKAKK